jgi:hypothetical protein
LALIARAVFSGAWRQPSGARIWAPVAVMLPSQADGCLSRAPKTMRKQRACGMMIC